MSSSINLKTMVEDWAATERVEILVKEAEISQNNIWVL